MATTINLGNFYDGFCGATYTCYLIYDGPTRSGDNVTITNVKGRIVSNQSWGTEGRIGVSLTIGGSSVLNNSTFVNSYTYPTDTTITLTSSKTVSNLTTSLSYSISFSDTGYSTTWNSNYSFSKSGSITCPARTYTISYNANGGSGAPGSQTKTYNVTLTLSSTVPTRSGYNFLGWSTSSTATTASYQPGGSYTGNGDATLYAVWELAVSLEDDPDQSPINYTNSWVTKTSQSGNVLKNIVYRIRSMNPLKLAEIDKLLGSPNVDAQDYVVEQGGKNVGGMNWIYRKWNSGIAECWGRLTTTLTAGTVWSGSVYYFQFNSVSYPFTFASVPTEIASPINGINAFWTYKESSASSGYSTSDNTTTNTARYGVLKLNTFNSGETATISIIVKGRWK